MIIMDDVLFPQRMLQECVDNQWMLNSRQLSVILDIDQKSVAGKLDKFQHYGFVFLRHKYEDKNVIWSVEKLNSTDY